MLLGRGSDLVVGEDSQGLDLLVRGRVDWLYPTKAVSPSSQMNTVGRRLIKIHVIKDLWIKINFQKCN